jgi:putative hemolysin
MLLELAVIFGLVLANGVFAGAEIAIVGVDRARLRQLVSEGGRRAQIVEALRKQPERFFATVQVVITVVGATAGAFGGATFARDLAPLLAPSLGEYADEVAVVVVVGIVSYLSLVVGELVPKSLALRHAETYALFIAPVLRSLASVARPLVWLLTVSSNGVLRLFGDRTTFAETRLAPNELRELVDEAADTGTLDPRAGEIASRAIDFAALTAEQVMIPRTRVVALRRDAGVEEIRRIVLEYAHSRLPVYEGDLDNIVGYVLYKDLLPLAWAGRLLVLEDIIRPADMAVEITPAIELLQRMRERRAHMVVVLDERGGTAGIITLDDLVDELVGEVIGEMQGTASPSVRPKPDGSALARGDTPIREVNRVLDLGLPEGDGWSTLGGLCMFLADGIPRQGDMLRLEDGTELHIEGASERAVELVRLIPSTSSEKSDAGAS